MDPKDFDDILKQKLKNFETSSNAMPDWERMERDLDSQKDQIFDEQVKRKLSQLSANNYSSANWSKLYDLISTRLMRKRTVLVSKSLELSVLFLLIFSLGQLGWLNEFKKEVHYAESFGTPVPQKIKSNELGSVEENSKVIEDEISDVVVQSLPDLSMVSTSERLYASAEKLPANNIDLYVQDVLEQNSSNITLNTNGIIASTDLIENELLPYPNNSESTLDQANSDIHGSIDDFTLVTAIENKLKIDDVFPLKDHNIQIVLPEERLKKNRFFAELGADIAVANIESALRNIPSRNKNADISTNKLYPVINGKFGWKFKKGTVQTGLEYQSISYDPVVSHVSGELSSILTETEIESVNYNIVSIPLTFSLNVLSSKKWDFRINAGLVTNVITNVDLIANQTLTSGGGGRITKIDNQNVDYSAFPLPINSGIFDESLDQDSQAPSPYFFQSQTGLQLERSISNNTSIISNFNYNFHLPILDFENQDNISSYSLGLAVRKYFG